MQDRLIFLIGSPRSGSTLLQRMIGSHSEVFSPAEPHILTPLAHLGYYHNVERAPYDHLNAAVSQRQYVQTLPGGEADYLDACRAYTDVLYQRRLEAEGAGYLLEKTPAYALVLDFLVKLYPKAHYVVLTRHPIAVWSSFVDSFFEGDYHAAHNHNRLLERYVPAVAWMLRERPVPFVHVRSEEVVREPEKHLRRICEHVGIGFEEGMVEYGRHKHDETGRGDPVNVQRHDRPMTKSVAKWAEKLAADKDHLAFVRRITDLLDEGDLKLWGYPKADLYKPMEGAGGGAKAGKTPMTRFRMERLVVNFVRKRVRKGGLVKRLLEKTRFYSDVLLRE